MRQQERAAPVGSPVVVRRNRYSLGQLARLGIIVALAFGAAAEPHALDILATIDMQMRRAIEPADNCDGHPAIGLYPGMACGPLHAALMNYCDENIRHFREIGRPSLRRQPREVEPIKYG